jgi:hypothetical protein
MPFLSAKRLCFPLWELNQDAASHFGNRAGAHQGKPLETHRGSFIIIKAAAVAADSFAERKRPVFPGCARSGRDGIRAE